MFVLHSRSLFAVINIGASKLLNSNLKHFQISAHHTSLLLVPKYNLEFNRCKSKNKKSSQHNETESETEEEDYKKDIIIDKNSKLMKIHVNSTRVDLLLKAGLGIARNKIETLFYEDKIRLNGQKILKKSEAAQEGDEIDVIKAVNTNNPELLTVARVEILSIKPKEEGFSIAVRRCKSLLVDNYENSGRK